MSTNVKDNSVIRRVVKEKKYAQIDNDLINNRSLSFKALGILTYILSKPDDWQIYISDLMREKDGEKSVRSGLKELIELKFMQRYRVYDMDTGKVHHWETLVSETPFDDSEIISSVKEKYYKNENGDIQNRIIRIKSFERCVPIVLEREVILLSQKGNVEKNNEDLLLSQNVQVENLQVENAGQQILNKTKTEIKTKTEYISNTSSKGEISPLVQLFEENICELKKTTLSKFLTYTEKYDSNFIKAIIEYGADTNAKSYKWFQTTIEAYIAKNMTTGEEVVEHIREYYEENKKAKNRALKQKEEKRKLSEEAHKRDVAGYYILDDIVDEDPITYDTENGEVINDLKDILQNEIRETHFNALIKSSDFIKLDNKIIIECPNKLTINAIEKRYYTAMTNTLRKNNIQERLILSIKKEI